MYLGYLTGLPIMLYKMGLLVLASLGDHAWLWQRLLDYVPARARRAVVTEARLVLGFHLLCVGLALGPLPGLKTVFAAQILGHALMSAYLTAEHNGLPHSGDIPARTRTTATHPLVCWLMWNMPWHVEHHAWPAIPWHALPKAGALLGDERPHTNVGYLAFHRRVLVSLLRGQPLERS
jgi:fatty acid desaturase